VAANISRCFEAELYFYGKISASSPRAISKPVKIDNL